MHNLTAEQWSIVESCLPTVRPHPHGGRPQKDTRDVLEGILWVMRSGSPWSSLPVEYPSRAVCRRRSNDWKDSGVLREILIRLDEDLRYRTGRSADDPTVSLPTSVRDRASWWWQTILLLRSPYAVMLLRPAPAGLRSGTGGGFEQHTGEKRCLSTDA